MHTISRGLEGFDSLLVNVHQLPVVRLFRVLTKILVPGIARQLEPCGLGHIASLLQCNDKRLPVPRRKKQPLLVRRHPREGTVIGYNDRGPDGKRLEH